MEKVEMLKLLIKLMNGCEIQVNNDNMELYDESPDTVVNYCQLEANINKALNDEKGKG